jgi:hypothetical protein
MRPIAASKIKKLYTNFPLEEKGGQVELTVNST